MRALAQALPIAPHNLDALHWLMTEVHDRIAYAPNLAADAPVDAETALQSGEGTSRDHAHAFIAAARVLKIPARYISGYVLADSAMQRIADAKQNAGDVEEEEALALQSGEGMQQVLGASHAAQSQSQSQGMPQPAHGAQSQAAGLTQQPAGHAWAEAYVEGRLGRVRSVHESLPGRALRAHRGRPRLSRRAAGDGPARRPSVSRSASCRRPKPSDLAHVFAESARPGCRVASSATRRGRPNPNRPMSIHVALHHTTRYRYDRLVNLGPQVVRLRPAPHCRTPILAYSMTVGPRSTSSTGSRIRSRTISRGSCFRSAPSTSRSRSISSPRCRCTTRSTSSSKPARSNTRSAMTTR